MNLSDLLRSIETIPNNHKNDTITIKKIAYHSNSVESDTLFVCIRGYQTDGHKYAEIAVKRGAAAIIVEQFLPELSIPQFLVRDSRKALAVLSDHFLDHPSHSMRLFGVTGTNGKTSITYMTDAIFSACQFDTGLIGTVMIKNKDNVQPSVLTTPESLDLQKYLAEMRDEGVSHVSMEVSSTALELDRVANVDFDVVAFTNIHKDHLDLHGSFEAYYNAKASLIRNASHKSTAILNIDEPSLEKLVTETKAQVVTFGLDNTSGHVSISNLSLSSGRPSFTVNINHPFKTLTEEIIYPASFDIALAIPGIHSISNALTAIITGLVNDIQISIIKKGIEQFSGVERRFHILYDDDFMILDDLFLNENNIQSSMRTLEKLPYESLHIVHAVRGNNGADLNRKNAETMAGWFSKLNVSKLILTVSQSHVKEKDQVSEEELDAFLTVMKAAGTTIDYYDELHDALSTSLEWVKSGDILLITGARGMDYGAKAILELLLDKKPHINQESIREILNNKMVGMKDLKSGS